MLHATSLPVAVFTSLRRDAGVFHDSRVSVWNYIPDNSLFPRGLTVLHHLEDLTDTSHFRDQPALHLAGLHLSPGHFLASLRERSWSELSTDLAFRSEQLATQGPFSMKHLRALVKNPGVDAESNYFICTLPFHQLPLPPP